MMKAIDLYSGIGGWTLGFKMAGVQIISSYEWWKDANNTHNKNFETSNREIDIRKLDLKTLPDPNEVDFVIGSPPCTQFSYANRGGNGDIADGLIDIYKFLEIVEYLNPKYWAMENVPRVAKILINETQIGGALERFKDLFSKDGIRVYDSSDFGVPQRRKRMIAGRLPFDLLESYKLITPNLTMGDILNELNKDVIKDPIYGTIMKKEEITDHIFESPLSEEESRLNLNAKSYHAVYNKMSFPDKLDRPARTITALCTRVSRESIVIEDKNKRYRRLTVRERGCMQSFPINFQYHSGSYGGKLKMIGNAVPPVLTFYIAQSMLERTQNEVVLPQESPNQFIKPKEIPIMHKPDSKGARYSWSRSFWLAIPSLRFGSGVRFELRNYPNKIDKSIYWRINLFYGNSKNIKGKELDYGLYNRINEIVGTLRNSNILELISEYKLFISNANIAGLQKNWTNIDRSNLGPIELIDKIGIYTDRMINTLKRKKELEVIKIFVENELRNGNGKIDNIKLTENFIVVFVGLVLGSCFNSCVTQYNVQEELAFEV